MQPPSDARRSKVVDDDRKWSGSYQKEIKIALHASREASALTPLLLGQGVAVLWLRALGRPMRLS